MRKYSLLLLGSVALAVITSILWYKYSSPNKIMLYPIVVKSANSGVEKVEIDFNTNALELNIETSKDMTCIQAERLFAIDSFVVKQKKYVPTCVKVSSSKLVITYKGEYTE